MATKKKKSKAVKKPARKPAAKKAAPKKKAAARPTPKKAAPKKAAAPKKPAAAKAQASSGTTLEAGQAAPAFALPGDDGQNHALAAHAGKPVVVYFYPRDDTPGCTVEACNFRDNMNRVAARGAVVFGVSKDSVASHVKFKAKHGLNFTLLSDEELTMHKAYGAWGTKLMYGKPTTGTIRSTFLIDAQGNLARVWPKVRVEGHVDEVLAALEAL